MQKPRATVRHGCGKSRLPRRFASRPKEILRLLLLRAVSLSLSLSLLLDSVNVLWTRGVTRGARDARVTGARYTRDANAM